MNTKSQTLVAIGVGVTLIGLLFYTLVKLRTPNKEVVTVTAKPWFRNIEVQQLGVERETTSSYVAHSGVISTQRTETHVVPDFDFSTGEIDLDLKQITYYTYRPWETVASARLETGEPRWPSTLYEEDSSTRFVYSEGYWIEFDEVQLIATADQHKTALVGEQFLVVWSYGVLREITPHLSEVTTANDFDY